MWNDDINATPKELPVITPSVKNYSAFQIHIEANDTRRGFTFNVRRDDVTVVADKHSPEGTSDTSDNWQLALSPYEKTNVIHGLLSIIRMRSQDEFKTAALLVTDTGKIHIGINSHVNPNRRTRQCAEQKTIARADDLETLEAIEENRARRPLKIIEAYIEGGDKGVHLAAPCGNCTDYLDKFMPPDGKVIVITSTHPKHLVELDDKAKSADKVRPGTAWITTIGHLNSFREVDIKAKYRHLLTDGTNALKQNIRGYFNASDRDDPNLSVLRTQETPGQSAVEKYTASARDTPEIDAAALNKFMIQQIYIIVADRVKKLAKVKGLDISRMSADALGEVIDKELKWARCSIVQRDDGTLFKAITVRTKMAAVKAEDEKTSITPEETGLGDAMPKLGTQGIRHVWVMEMHPKDAARGVMRTSPKTAVERLLKRASKITNTIEFHYLPWNNGRLSEAQVKDAMINLSAEEIYPSAHLGVRRRQDEPELPMEFPSR